MPATVNHVLTATTPDDPLYEIRPSHWNSAHALTLAPSGAEIVGAFSNANGLSFGLSAGQVTGSYTVPNVAAFLTTAALSNHSHGVSLNLTNLSGTTAGNSDGITLSLSAAAPGGGGGSLNLSAGTTSNNLTAVTFADSNGVSFGLNGSVVTATVATNYQSQGAYLTTARASNDAVGLNTALTAGPLAWTVNSSGISLNAGSAAGTTSGFTGNLISGSMTHNTAGLALSLNHPAWLTTAAASNHSHGASGQNGSFAFQTLSFSNANGVSFGTSAGNAITASHNGITSQSNQQITAYATSNTTQSSSGTYNASSMIFAGAGIASVGVTNGSVLISVPAGGGAGDGGNVLAAGTRTAGSNSTVLFSNANGVTFGLDAVNGSVMTASVDAGGAAPLIQTFVNRQLGASQSTQWTNNQMWVAPFRVANVSINASTMQMLQSLSGTFTSAVAATFAETMRWCIYSNNTTNSTRFDTWTSGSLTWQVWNSGTSSGSYAFNGATSSSAGTSILTQAAGVRILPIDINTTVSPGLYLMVLANSTSSAGYSGLFSRYGMVMDSPLPLANGLGFGSGTATSIGYVDGGTVGTTSAAMPASLGWSDIKQHSNLMPFFKLGAL